MRGQQLFLLVLASAGLAHVALAQAVLERGIVRPLDLTCGVNVPLMATVTELAGGSSISITPVDVTLDVLPACDGQIAPPPGYQSVGALPNPIPQLVKILVDTPSGEAQCSGALLSPNTVITAAHCLFNPLSQRFFKNVRVIPGYQKGAANFGSRAGAYALTFSGYTQGSMPAHDIAAIRLNAPLEDIYNGYGLAAFDRTLCTNNQPKDLFEPHYNPLIENNQAQALYTTFYVTCVRSTIQTALGLGPGSSGSALVDHYSRAVFGIHSQYSLNAPISFAAPLTKAKVCLISSFMQIGEPSTPLQSDCGAGN